MGSDLKELKYRRRIGVEERAQCSDPRGGADWTALQQDPVELLRKLDELRDQITRSCHVVGQPREHRRVSRRAVSLLPEHLEPPPLPGYHRSGHYCQYPGKQWENGGCACHAEWGCAAAGDAPAAGGEAQAATRGDGKC